MGHVRFKMPVRHLNGDVKEVVDMSLQFRKKVWTADKKFGDN